MGKAEKKLKPSRKTPVDRSFEGLLRILEQDSTLSQDQITEARRRVSVVSQELKRNASRGDKAGSSQTIDPAQIIAHMAFRDSDHDLISEDRIAEVFARHAGFKYIKLDPLKLDPKLVTDTLTLPFSRRHTIIPITMDPREIVVATNNPYDVGVIDQIERLTKRKVVVWIASRADILKIIRDLYGFRSSVSKAATEFDTIPDLQNLEAFVSLKSGEEIEASDTHIVNAVEYLLRYAFDQRASDIHIEPHRDDTDVRMRIDGVLHSVYRIPRPIHPPIVSRIKSMGRLDIAEKRRPQDGRIKTAHEGREIELRISVLPVAFGEKIVIRLLDPRILVQSMMDLGMFSRQLEGLRRLIYRPNGLLLVTGPTGSGKTTTLYSVLRDLATPEVNITTIEDPIEMLLDDFNQVGVNTAVGLDFSKALRTILRQDPDIVMVGEIRDGETAHMAVQAALTGHLVLSTVHTNDAAGAITRLQDLGVPNYLLSATLTGVVAQRLVRRICSRCKVRMHLTTTQCRELSIPLQDGEPPKLNIYQGAGCPHCRETGYRGRSGSYELLPVTESIREKIANGSDLSEIRRAALSDGMMSLRESAIKKMAQGITSFEEVLRVTASIEK